MSDLPFDLPASSSLPIGGSSDEMAEAILVRLAQGGCPDAFRTLVERYQQRIYLFCFRYLRDSCDAKEVCQDTFVRAYDALARYRPRARFTTWLFRISLNLCHDRSRARRPTVKRSTRRESEEFPCPAAAPDRAAELAADMVKLDRGLAALPEKLRDVLILSCLDNLSHGECAAILKCSERAVEGRLYRARRELAKWWDTTCG